MWHDVLEDAFLQPLFDLLGVVAAAGDHDIQPALRLGFPGGERREGFWPEEQPPVAEGLAGIGLAGLDQGFGQVYLVEVRTSGVGPAAVQPPQPAVGDDDPFGVAAL